MHLSIQMSVVRLFLALSLLAAGASSEPALVQNVTRLAPGHHVTLSYKEPTSLKSILRELGREAGITVLFDEAFADVAVTVELSDASVEDALDKLLIPNRCFYKVVDPSTVIVSLDSAQKRRQYEELLLHTFFVEHTDLNAMANAFRTLAAIQRVQPNAQQNTINVRATADQIVVANRLLELNDRKASVVVVDAEVLAVHDADVPKSTASEGADALVSFSSEEAYSKFKADYGVDVLAGAQLRVTPGRPATMHIGDEVPLPIPPEPPDERSTQGWQPDKPLPPYRKVGFQLWLDARGGSEGVADLGVRLETSAQRGMESIGGLDRPVFWERRIETALRVRVGETHLVRTLARWSDVAEAFSASEHRDASNERAVVVALIARIVQSASSGPEDAVSLPMGTEMQITVPRELIRKLNSIER